MGIAAAVPKEGPTADVICIDTGAIPDYVRDRLADATLDLLRGILNQPGGRERLEKKKMELAARR